MTSGKKKETVLVTGASSGIGLQLAKLFAADGSHLVLVARSEAPLNELAEELRKGQGIDVHVVPLDLSKSEAPRQLFDMTEEQGLTIDVVVNNAGFGLNGELNELDQARQIDMVRVNTLALTELTLRYVPGMIERGAGGILNVGSTASFQALPLMAVYGATKAYVLSLTEALAEELRGTGVKVSCLCPGPTETGFGAEAGMGNALIFNLGLMKVSYVARLGHRGLRRGKVVVVPGFFNRFSVLAVRFLPRWLVRRIAYFLQKRT